MMNSFVNQFKDYKDSVIDQRCKEMADDMSSNDYTVLWIGQPYEGLDGYLGNHLVTMSPEEVSRSNMPINNYLQDVTEKTENGDIIERKTRDEFADNIFIVVNCETELDPDTVEIIRLCVVNTNCELLVIGKLQTDCFRETLLIPKLAQTDDYFLYSALTGTDVDHIEFLSDKYSPCQGILKTFDSLLPLPQPTPVVVETYSTGDNLVIVETITEESELEPKETDGTIESTVIYYYGN